jgi:hypothetical protein
VQVAEHLQRDLRTASWVTRAKTISRSSVNIDVEKRSARRPPAAPGTTMTA